MTDHVGVDDARKRYTDGPWVALAVGAGLCTDFDEAWAAGVSLPVPEFSLELEPRATAVRALFYDTYCSITTIHRWRSTGTELFFEKIIVYTYPDEPRFHGQDESLRVWSMDFEADGTAQENTQPLPPPGAFLPEDNFVDHTDVPLDDHYLPVPEFGDWAALGHRDRYPPP